MSKEDFVERVKTDAVFARKHGELPRIYGEMWRRWPATDGRGIDQLSWAIEELKSDPGCHNAIVTSWNPEYLYTMAKPEAANKFPICHNMFQFNIKNEKLSLQLYQRSADMFLGVPFNIASYALLCMIVARVIGREAGDFVHTFGDYHMYEDHLDQVREQVSREPKPFPSVTISDEVKSIGDFRPEHVTLANYDAHPAIKAPLTVSGFRNLDNKPSGR
jgi:thymidylate synthase